MRHQRFSRPSLTTGVALAMLLTALVASPALADQPTEVTEQIVFEDVNPCDPPNTMVVTIDFVIKVHDHANNYVETISSWASTDAGFSGPGVATTVVTGEVERATWHFLQTNPETGQLSTVKGRSVINLATGEVLVETQELRCIIW